VDESVNIDSVTIDSRPMKYEAWDMSAMVGALSAVEKGEPVRRAAEMYNVPKSTLYDHINGKVKLGARSGPPPYLTVAEEEELVSFLIGCAAVGYPHTRKDVLTLVQHVINTKGIKSKVIDGWWSRF